MHTFSVVKQFDIIKQISFHFLQCSIFLSVNPLPFCDGKETLQARIVIRASRTFSSVYFELLLGICGLLFYAYDTTVTLSYFFDAPQSYYSLFLTRILSTI